jgi:hypothetical protein
VACSGCMHAEDSKPHVQSFCTPWNLGAVLVYTLLALRKLTLLTCIVVGDVMSRGHRFSGRPGATIQDAT